MPNELNENFPSLSKPPGFSNYILNKECQSYMCQKHLFSGSSNRRKVNTLSWVNIKDIDGTSLLDVMARIAEVGNTLGYKMEGCNVNIESIVKEIGVKLIDNGMRCL